MFDAFLLVRRSVPSKKLVASLAIHSVLFGLILGITERTPGYRPVMRVTKMAVLAPQLSTRKYKEAPPPAVIPPPRTFHAPPQASPIPTPTIRAELAVTDAPIESPPTSPAHPPPAILPPPVIAGGFTTVASAKTQAPPASLHTGIFGTGERVEQAPGSPRIVRTGGLEGLPATGPSQKRQEEVAESGLGTAVFASPQKTGSTSPTAPKSAITIDYKPKPEYTDEARRQRIEGEVIVRVRFKASGEAEALDVFKKLGYGLDESALAAVKEIRFHAGIQDGVPADEIAAVHFIFRLAY